MRTRLVASFVTWLSLLAVTAVAGGYAVTYLFQWQWVRAQIAGIAFVAALVVASSLAVLSRLRRLERRIDLLTALVVEQTRPDGGHGGAVDVEPRPDFRWLAPATSAPGLLALPALALVAVPVPDRAVFIPVFLATGLVVAGLASVVERLSALRHGNPVLVVPRPGPLTAPPAAPDATKSARPLVLVPLVGVLVTAGVIGGLWWTTHYRSEPIGAGTTTLTVEVRRSGTVVHGATTVEAVGRYCSATSGVGVRFVDVRPGPATTTLLRVSPLLDEDAENRYSGCVQDAIVDRRWLTVRSVELTPERIDAP